jgi:hypothetical protein
MLGAEPRPRPPFATVQLAGRRLPGCLALAQKRVALAPSDVTVGLRMPPDQLPGSSARSARRRKGAPPRARESGGRAVAARPRAGSRLRVRRMAARHYRAGEAGAPDWIRNAASRTALPLLAGKPTRRARPAAPDPDRAFGAEWKADGAPREPKARVLHTSRCSGQPDHSSHIQGQSAPTNEKRHGL